MYKQIILRKVPEYLKLKNWKTQKSGKMFLLQCPYCKKDPVSANIIPYSNKINCFECNKQFNLLDIVRQIETDKRQSSDEDIFYYLKTLLNIEVVTDKEITDIEDLLNKYQSYNFDLVPIAKRQKKPIEKDWTNKHHRNKSEWSQWILNGLNIGVKTGKVSNITVIDIDAMPSELKEQIYKNQLSEEEIQKAKIIRNSNLKKVLDKLNHPEKTTLYQESLGGIHLFFKYTDKLPKTKTIIEGVGIDIENDGGQVLIPPSKVENKERILHYNPILDISDEILTIFQNQVTVPRKTHSEEIKEDIKNEAFNLGILTPGMRNDSLIKLGGVVRKELNPYQTERILHIINNHCCDPKLTYQEVKAMANSLDRYTEFDEEELAHEILEYLKSIESVTKPEIEIAIFGERVKGEIKKRLDKAMLYLENEDKIVRKGRFYKAIKQMDWTDTLLDVGVPVDFKVPYFHDFAHFNWGDLVIIGSQTKYGKTTLAMNILKRLVDQGIKPYYIYSETGGRFAKTALHLGLKEGDFFKVRCHYPEEIILKDRAVTVYDWVCPPDFSKTDKLFDGIVQKAEKTQGFIICFVQLKNTKEEKNKWFASNMLPQFPALACKYIYDTEDDGTHTRFELTDIREGKMKGKTHQIPCIYDWEAKTVTTVAEVKEKEGKVCTTVQNVENKQTQLKKESATAKTTTSK
jgi:hypothetical protein